MLNETLDPRFGRILEAVSVGDWAVAALLLSCVAFVLICFGALRHERDSTDRFAAIPLSDRVEDPRDAS